MGKQARNTNPKKRNRYTDEGVLLPGIEQVRELRKKLMRAQRAGAPESDLEQLRAALKKARSAGKAGD